MCKQTNRQGKNNMSPSIDWGHKKQATKKKGIPTKLLMGIFLKLCNLKLWFLWAALLYTTTYVYSKFDVNWPYSYEVMTQKRKFKMWYNSEIKQARVMVLVHCTSSQWNQSIYEFSCEKLLYFKSYTQRSGSRPPMGDHIICPFFQTGVNKT